MVKRHAHADSMAVSSAATTTLTGLSILATDVQVKRRFPSVARLCHTELFSPDPQFVPGLPTQRV